MTYLATDCNLKDFKVEPDSGAVDPAVTLTLTASMGITSIANLAWCVKQAVGLKLNKRQLSFLEEDRLEADVKLKGFKVEDKAEDEPDPDVTMVFRAILSVGQIARLAGFVRKELTLEVATRGEEPWRQVPPETSEMELTLTYRDKSATCTQEQIDQLARASDEELAALVEHARRGQELVAELGANVGRTAEALTEDMVRSAVASPTGEGEEDAEEGESLLEPVRGQVSAEGLEPAGAGEPVEV